MLAVGSCSSADDPTDAGGPTEAAATEATDDQSFTTFTTMAPTSAVPVEENEEGTMVGLPVMAGDGTGDDVMDDAATEGSPDGGDGEATDGAAPPSGGTGDAPPVSPEGPAPVCNTDIAAQFDRADIALDAQAQQDQTVPVVVAPDPTGGFWVAWTDSPWALKKLHARVRHVDASLRFDGPSFDLPGEVVLGIHVHSDGTLAVAHGKRTGAEPADPNWGGSPTGAAANTLFLSRFSAAGAKQWGTKIAGGEGYERGSTWFLNDRTGATVTVGYDGAKYAVHYVIGRYFDDGGVHQADQYAELTPGGQIVDGSRRDWMNSHSFWPSAIGSGGAVYSLTVSDGFPESGMRLARNGTDATTVWPWARPGAMFTVGGSLAVAVQTNTDKAAPTSTVEGGWWPSALIMGTDGSIKAVAQFPSQTEPTYENLVVGGARFGDDILVLASNAGNAGVFGAAPVKAYIATTDGQQRGSTATLDARLSWQSDPVTLADGSVVWAAIKDNVSNTLQLNKVRCR
ncbi:MAG: hypothetical protein AAGD35_14290 [Actinomycetota bacterium]